MQYTQAERLADVIQTIQLGNRTGTLTVKRTGSSEQEEGVIDFAQGRITHASLGRQMGQEALQKLLIWGNCLFAFTNVSTHVQATKDGSFHE